MTRPAPAAELVSGTAPPRLVAPHETTSPPEPDPAPLPRLRLLPAPECDPPYDDERPRRALHLVQPLRSRPVPAPQPVPPQRAAPAVPIAPVAPPGRLLPSDGPPRRTPTAELPDVRVFARALVHRLVEVRGGVRPISQLRRDTSPALFDDLERALVRRAPAAGPRPTGRDVRSVHVQARPDGVAEVCATVRSGQRAAALALRLEGVRGAWVCTQLQGL